MRRSRRASNGATEPILFQDRATRLEAYEYPLRLSGRKNSGILPVELWRRN